MVVDFTKNEHITVDNIPVGYAKISLGNFGKIHNLFGPAITYNKGHEIFKDGFDVWVVNGCVITDPEQHVYSRIVDDYEEWTDKDGKRHRPDYGPFKGPAFNYRGIIEWTKHGKMHRDPNIGPARKCDCSSYYYVEGKKHREDGPAHIEYINCVVFKKWYLNGIEIEDASRHVIRSFEDGCWVWRDRGRKIHRPLEGAFSGPAMIDEYGNKSWYTNGVLIRTEKFELSKIDGDIKKIQINDISSRIQSSDNMCFCEEYNLKDHLKIYGVKSNGSVYEHEKNKCSQLNGT